MPWKPCTAFLGITPARAGRRRRYRPSRQRSWDHPRTRGEESSHPYTPGSQTGSPPHARGGGVAADALNEDEGITPARAGRSFSTSML